MSTANTSEATEPVTAEERSDIPLFDHGDVSYFICLALLGVIVITAIVLFARYSHDLREAKHEVLVGLKDRYGAVVINTDDVNYSARNTDDHLVVRLPDGTLTQCTAAYGASPKTSTMLLCGTDRTEPARR